MTNHPLADPPQCNTGPEGGSAIRLIKNGVAEVVTGCRGSREETTIDHFVGGLSKINIEKLPCRKMNSDSLFLCTHFYYYVP